jgi:metal-responsive CopG/Arc/MetJ family transcriptional regulator
VSYSNVDSRTGKKRKRISPVVKLEFDEEFLKKVDEIAKELGMSRSEIIDRCILMGIHDFAKEHGVEC